MDKIGYIEIEVKGKKGNIELSPDNYDVKDIIAILEMAENLLFPSSKKDRPLITYSLEQGSVKHIIKTSIQAVIGFNAILAQISSSNSIDFLEIPTAKAIENFQENAIKHDYEFQIKTSLDNSHEIHINKFSRLNRTQNIWVDAEFYFYGTLTNAGGKNKPNIHLDTEEHGSLSIATNKQYLEEKEENFLYKRFGVRAIGKQNIETGELDRSTLKLLELIDYNPKFDSAYLNTLMKKASTSWSGITDADEWLNSIRGGYDA